ncbi:MAG: dolichol-phosphate mannosyltransferase [Leifsonia xyli]|nr:MAG: dolichol-phosphate mannosyltransferase [Leifsonia xyli]
MVILPTYNERENLQRMVERLWASVPHAHVLVVDDGSPDGTGDLADAIAAADDRVHVLHRTVKAGLGAAYLAGFQWALHDGFDVIVECDADGSHQPEELPRLLQAIAEGADLVIGSRWVDGGSVVDWPLGRRLLSRGGSAYARLMLRLPQRDVTGGYRAFRAATLDSLALGTVASEGYCFQIELLWRAVRRGFRIVEVPITFTERTHGTSKMDSRIVIEAMWRVTGWGLALLAGQPEPAKVPSHA